MFSEPWIWMTGAVVLAAGAVTACWLAARRPLRTSIERARKLFHLQREHLEFRFFTIAARSGKPRGLEWVDCDFEDEVSFARDRTTGRLRALVGLTIRFRAIEGGEMEDNPNADNLRAASALFHLEGSDWGTEGRAIFNLNPTEAIQHYRQELEVVE